MGTSESISALHGDGPEPIEGDPPIPVSSPASNDAVADSLGEDRTFLAASPSMRALRKQVLQVASTDIPVLLLGESGTGKEMMARLIHKFSLRVNRIFMKVN